MKVGSWLILMTMLAQSEDNQLPRRGYFGVGLEKAENGARVFSVAPDSTAAAAQIVVGDVIEAVDGRPGTTPEAVVALIGRHKGRESIKIDIRREGNRRTIDVILKRYPVEQMANATVQYGSVAALPAVRLRTILSIPSERSTGRFPAVLLLQGGSCGSIDTPFSPDLAQVGLIHTIGSQGVCHDAG